MCIDLKRYIERKKYQITKPNQTKRNETIKRGNQTKRNAFNGRHIANNKKKNEKKNIQKIKRTKNK